MDDKITLTLNSPITEEQWGDITDVDFKHTDRIWFTTKHGDRVEFVKAPAQPESLSDAYMKAVWTWLLDYQIKAAELNGRYTPYEVLSWVVNDWRKEYERPDIKAGGD